MRLFAIALVALGLAACAGGDDVPEESPARFAVRIATLLRQGEFATAWIDLHPELTKLVTRSDLESCWTQTDDVLNYPDVRLRVTSVADEDWAIPGTTMTRPSKAITVEAVIRPQSGGSRVLETWTQHAFDVGSEGWAWILAPALLEDARNDVC